jgi:NAD(P)-dependent dehydrogenase (short-subunit alcohol dehydrogenase family)
MKIALEGKRVLITGASGPVGGAIAAELAASGGAVVEAGSRLDLGSAEGAEAAAAAWVARHGAPYLLVNIGEGLAPGSVGAPGDEIERFALAARAFAPSARRVINVFSVAGLVPLRGAAAFSARQAGLASMTRALAMELAPDVVVNGLAVGDGDRLVSHTALKRAGTPAEVAKAALFLADPANTYMTGHVMVVDGGWSAGYARDF